MIGDGGLLKWAGVIAASAIVYGAGSAGVPRAAAIMGGAKAIAEIVSFLMTNEMLLLSIGHGGGNRAFLADTLRISSTDCAATKRVTTALESGSRTMTGRYGGI